MSGDRDLLERATRALREATPPTQDELAAGRARLLAAHRGAQKSARARTLRWLLPLAAVLAAGSALAATPVARERLAHAVSSLLAPDTTKLAKPKPRRVLEQVASRPTAAPRPQPAPAPAPSPKLPQQPIVDALPPVVSAAPNTPVPRRLGKVPRAASPGTVRVVEQTAAEPAPAPTPVPVPADEPESDGDLASYRAAHRSHFRQRDFVGALREWNDYLLAYPHGTFAVEARYNRAICLVRLGQKDDARKALAPFARGEVAHGYRQAEANKLLEALE